MGRETGSFLGIKKSFLIRMLSRLVLHDSSKYLIDLTLQDHHEGSHLVRKVPSPPGMDSWLKEEHKALTSGNISSSSRPPAMSQTKQNQLMAKKSQMAMSVAMKPG